MGYGFTFRYCPSGKHVAYSEGSRSPHDGDLEFISVDLHKGCGKRAEKGLRTMRQGQLSHKEALGVHNHRQQMARHRRGVRAP